MLLNETYKSWYVAYTYPNAEKKVKRMLEQSGVTSFLPLQKVVRKWSDRTKKLELPFFPNYIFIYTSFKEMHIPLKIKGILRYVTFEGNAATISDGVIESLKKILIGEAVVSNKAFHQVGTPVKITRGPFVGIEGKIARQNGKTRLLVQIKSLNRVVSVDISSDMVENIDWIQV